MRRGLPLAFAVLCSGCGGGGDPSIVAPPVPPDGAVGSPYNLGDGITCAPSGTTCAPCFVGGSIRACPANWRYQNSFVFTATDGLPPFFWTATSLPPGLTLASNGSIDGTPTTAGTYATVVTVTDSSFPARSTTNTATIVIAPPLPPTIATSPAPSKGAIDQPYLNVFVATDGTEPLTWSETGELPPGARFRRRWNAFRHADRARRISDDAVRRSRRRAIRGATGHDDRRTRTRLRVDGGDDVAAHSAHRDVADERRRTRRGWLRRYDGAEFGRSVRPRQRNLLCRPKHGRSPLRSHGDEACERHCAGGRRLDRSPLRSRSQRRCCSRRRTTSSSSPTTCRSRVMRTPQRCWITAPCWLPAEPVPAAHRSPARNCTIRARDASPPSVR